MKSEIDARAHLECRIGLLLNKPYSALISRVHAVPVVGSQTTITKSSQVVNHGSPVVHAVHTPVVHAAPVVHSAPVVAVHSAPVVHAVHTPVVHAVHTPVVHAAPVVVRTVPSAVAHSSSVVHHGHVVKSVPLVAVHH
ncbi:hypothetical protein MSG28_007845 [Choristoneura fumiferana]|uniref:Uncharacterized protein n=1 Tax=Choristoneura fumiferana TaxID=7141 RepID=A0ACC0J935_CHOFU|nr:hypothetical protein MSG28_007845 [Choristoneura fumiferana]